MQDELLRTKLQGPRLPAAPVPRPRLLNQLLAAFSAADGWRRPATLISAPAGYGKTTLLSAWRADAAHPVVWLSLETGDDDLPRFLAYLIAALRQMDDAIGAPTLAALAATPPPPAPALLAPLLNELGSQPQPLAIVLDDYHAIEQQAIHDAVAFLVEHLPPSTHLVISTREDPPLPLARWRAAGRLVEIRMDALRFSVPETASFLHEAMQLALTEEQVTALAARTEGWIAGLQLAAVAMQGRDDVAAFVASFTGSNRYILDYLLEEVFRQQPPAVQKFLLVTSILDRFSAPLCEAVLAARDEAEPGAPPPRPAARAVLADLERQNLFLVALDDRRDWFRYHHLFAELLRHQLRLRGWDTAALHAAAGRWYAEREMPAAAIDHLLAARDWERAASMLARQGDPMLKRGETRTLLRWVRQLPEDAIRSQPQLAMNYAWALIFSGHPETAMPYVDAAAAAAPGDIAMRRGVLAARAYVARMRHDLPATISLSRQALELTPESDASGRAVLAVGLGIAYWQNGQTREADEALFTAIQAGQQSGNHYAQVVATGFLATVRATMGQLRHAADLLRDAVSRSGDYPPVALAHQGLGALLYEWDDLEGAAAHLEQAVALARRTGNAELSDGALRQLARLRQAQGDAPGALAALQEAWRVVGEEAPPLTRARIAAACVQLALAQGDVMSAEHWAERRTFPIDASPFYPRLDLTPARLSLARGDKAAAARHLAGEAQRALDAGWQYGLIETRLLQALAAADDAEAASFVAAALSLARPEGYVRTFVDKGPPLAALLRRGPFPVASSAYAQTLLRHFDAAPEPEPAPAGPAASPLADPLSEREQEILALLARRRSNAEIAQALTVSVNTVKTHLRHIYEKLGVHDRREAVGRARELNLLR